MTVGIRQYNRLLKEPMCRLCGHFGTIQDNRCRYCGADPRQWWFLEAFQVAPSDLNLTVTLKCFHTNCPGQMKFPISALAATVHPAGNGPNSYPLGCRFALQARCPVCNVYCGHYELIRHNRDALLAVLLEGNQRGLASPPG